MNRIAAARPAACAAFLSGALLAASPVLAQTPPPAPELKNPRIIVDYVEPRSSQFQDLHERLKKRQVLEELAQFLSPLKLPLALRIKFQECGTSDADYDPMTLRVRICYDLIDFMEQHAPKADAPLAGLITRQDAIVGNVASVILHETGHALFDLLKVPVLGGEEDAADQIAGFIALQFGKDVARTTINGAAFDWIASATNGSSKPDFDDAHSTPQQRAYTFACLAYGGYPDTFKDYVETGLLPKERAANCKSEYEQAKLAFAKTILPHIDLDTMKKVQARTWSLSTDGK
jgi:hypothetical protein